MDDAQSTKAPIHLWIVGPAGDLVGRLRLFDYLMTPRNLDYFRTIAADATPEARLAWVDAPRFPRRTARLGVWMGLARLGPAADAHR
jgi:hypothetical protein